MTIIIFLLVLGFLVFVHELGHFWAARISGVKVEEFGIGLPPKAFSYKPKNSEVEYSINWLPIGGFVKIFGENYEAIEEGEVEAERSFVSASKIKQVFIMIAGVVMNFLAAVLLFALAGYLGMYQLTDEVANRDGFIVTAISPGSPADQSGLPIGASITEVSNGANKIAGDDITSAEFTDFIRSSTGAVLINYLLDGEANTIEITPETEIISDESDELAIGVYAASLEFKRAGPVEGITSGFSQSVIVLKQTTASFAELISSIFDGQGKESFKSLAGPVGIAQLSAQAYSVGAGALLSFAAILSLNLVVLNLLPIPALDGGRIVFVIIEAIKGSPLNAKIAGYANMAGFGLLLLLMLAVTLQDIIRVF